MRLSDFILENVEPILQAWEDFARSVETPMPAMDAKGLRNHAEYILNAVALDLRTAQTEQQQIDKSHGLGPVADDESPASEPCSDTSDSWIHFEPDGLRISRSPFECPQTLVGGRQCQG